MPLGLSAYRDPSARAGRFRGGGLGAAVGPPFECGGT